MVDIFTEVEEDLRRERAKRLWDRYGWIPVTVVLVIVAATAGFQGWRWYEAREAAAASERFLAATRAAESNNHAVAIEGFAGLTRDAPAGYRLLARFQEAGARAKAGERAIAVGLWDQIVADSTTPAPYRELAVLLTVLHQMDGGDPALLASRIEPLTRADGPFRFSAREIAAVLAEKRGERERAVGMLRELANAADAPNGVRSRAAQMLGALTGVPVSPALGG